jgi:predicted RNase H-like nuclease
VVRTRLTAKWLLLQKAPQSELFLRVLQEEGYLHSPMAIPSATAGRFYFECYPHPAIIGLFDLDRILQYKVHHSNQMD